MSILVLIRSTNAAGALVPLIPHMEMFRRDVAGGLTNGGMSFYEVHCRDCNITIRDSGRPSQPLDSESLAGIKATAHMNIAHALQMPESAFPRVRGATGTPINPPLPEGMHVMKQDDQFGNEQWDWYCEACDQRTHGQFSNERHAHVQAGNHALGCQALPGWLEKAYRLKLMHLGIPTFTSTEEADAWCEAMATGNWAALDDWDGVRQGLGSSHD